jgi:signal transduction histidine kinase
MATDDVLSSAQMSRPARRSNSSAYAPGRRPATPPPEPALLDLDFDKGGLAQVRATVAAYASTLAAGEVVDDLLLVVNELCGNAIRHGGGPGRLRMWTDRHQLTFRVTDYGPGMPEAEVQGLELPDLQTAGGRGIWIARRLADLRIDTGPFGTTVTATMPLA